MNYDGEWKLAKYASGDVMQFNVKDDPAEQINRIDHSDCQENKTTIGHRVNHDDAKVDHTGIFREKGGNKLDRSRIWCWWLAANLPYVNCGK